MNTAVVIKSVPRPGFQWSRDLACTLSHSTASPDDNEVDFYLGFIRLSLSDSSLTCRILTPIQVGPWLGTVPRLSCARTPFGTHRMGGAWAGHGGH